MRYTEIHDLSPSTFKRLTGVHLKTFSVMLEVITTYKLANRKHPTKGRKPYKLSAEDNLLMLLMYYREYRTFLHISKSYGISEMQCWRIVTELEKILLQSKLFHLPGKKALHNGENNFETIVVDVSEHPIERPKKNSEKIILAKRKSTR
jgi:Helix-turn-helix of DDE superfamily endonuclease